MNILYINHYAGSPQMGMEFRPFYLAKEWMKNGHTVTIIAADYSHLRVENPTIKNDFEETVIDGIKYVWIKTGTYEGNGAKRAITMLTFVGKLRKNTKRLVKQYKPDIVIASSTYPLDTYAAIKIRKYSKAKYIHEVHDMWPSTLYEVGGMSRCHPFVILMQIAENTAYKNCDELVALLPYTKSYMVKHGLCPIKFHNIQNGIVEEEWYSNIDIPKQHKAFFEQHHGQFIVGYFGGHALSNALDSVLNTAKICQDPDIAFVLVGKGIEKDRLIERKERENLKNVFFLPPVSKKEVPALTGYFDCSIMTGTVSPLYRFGLCLNKMYDSMMSGRPIICAIAAPRTLVEEYNCGFQVNSNNPQDILEAIRQVKNMSENERIRLGTNGKKAVLEYFTYHKLAIEFERLFN